MGVALLVEYYQELPRARRRGIAQTRFKQRVAARYSEGTLHRLLVAGDAEARRAAVYALGLVGTMQSNAALADRLGDDDLEVRRLAADALWAVWFRANGDARNRELRRAQRQSDPDRKRAALDALIRKAPTFAEAYNQRAIHFFQQGELHKTVADCERVLELNPFHFGAQVGLAQAYMGLGKPRAALKAFRGAYRLNPGMEGVEDTIKALEDALGEGGKKSDER